MFDSVFEIDKIAVTHCRYRLGLLLTKKENIEIKPILEEQLKEKLELLDEIIECHNTNNEKQRREQWDRYQFPICKALLLFREDLDKSSKTIFEFGSEEIKLNIRKTNDFLNKIDIRLHSFEDIINVLKSHPLSSPF